MAFSFAFPLPEARSHLTVHEWGTFTSIAGPDGVAVDWLPLTGSTDLPSFIEHLENADFKGGLRGTIRMETPVLYFYSPQETTVSVHATFCKGLITEWYPHASVPAIDPRRDFALEQKPTEGSITWDSVQIEPLGPADFPTASSANRYYAARQTASARLTVNSSAGPQHEKFLFYRGVSATLAPLTVALSADGTVWLQNQQPGGCPAGSETRAGSHGTAETLPPEASGGGAFLLSALQKTGQPSVRHSLAVSSRTVAAKLPSENTPKEIPDIILFERRGSRVGYHILGPLSDQASFAQPALDGSLEALSSDLEGMLIGQGLFADEAHAMLETWKSSWFEEGSRVLYLVPRPFVDSVLPLTITPAPAQITRVFVGRIELVTPATEQAVESAFAANDRATLAKYSRFLDTIIRVMRESATDQPTRDRLDNDLNTAFSTFYSPSHN